MKYTIEWLEVKKTSTGKTKADTTLVSENGVVTDKVTIWESFPGFVDLKPAGTVEGEIKITTNGNFTNKTLYPATAAPAWATKKPSVITKAMETKAQNIEKAQEHRAEGIQKASIIRDSTLLTVAWKEGKSATVDEMKAMWEEWNKWLEAKWSNPF